MDLLVRALASHHSTILLGYLGRYPSTLQFYINAIPELEYASDYELIFWHAKGKEKRLLHIFIEPRFGVIVPPENVIVFTSHLDLVWNPLTTRIVHCSHGTERIIPIPCQPNADQIVVIPPTTHSHPFLRMDEEEVRIDLSAVDNIHEAYLRLLTIFDVLRPTSKWSLSIPEKLRLSLLNHISLLKSPYEKVFLKVLG